jgi:hypothetical protein
MSERQANKTPWHIANKPDENGNATLAILMRAHNLR